MTIRLATAEDYKSICASLRNKHIFYNTPAQAKEDIANSRLYIVVENNKPIAQYALVYDKHYDYYAIKRVVIYNKKNCGKGICQLLVDHALSFNYPRVGCTPWEENVAMRKILVKNGFEYQYTFLEKYQFFLLTR
jgi:RimJ/RimL family protein N-acetyltransferase